MHKKLRRLTNVIIGSFLVFYFLDTIKIGLITTNDELKISSIIIALMLFIFSFFVKIIRVILLLGPDTFFHYRQKRHSIRELLYDLSIGAIAQIIIPFKLGEVIRIQRLTKYTNGFFESATLILYERLTDLVTVMILLIFFGLSKNSSIESSCLPPTPLYLPKSLAC